MDQFSRVASVQTTDPSELLAAVVGVTPGGGNPTPTQPVGTGAPGGSPHEGALNYPASWQIEPVHQRFLFDLVRSVRPERLLETGVADGVSTRTILSAMASNGTGRLVSVEIAENVGSLVPPDLRGRWRLEVLPRHGRARALVSLLRQEGPIDVFLHDSRHTYENQLFEYRAAWQFLRPEGVLLSDDADSSFALLDFARQVHRAPGILVGRRKLLAALGKPPVPVRD